MSFETFDDYVERKPPLTTEQQRTAGGLLSELCGASASWPHAAELARHLRELCHQELPKQNCLIVWVDNEWTDTTVWSIALDDAEMAALTRAHGLCLEKTDPDIELLEAALGERGHKQIKRVTSLWLVARVETL